MKAKFYYLFVFVILSSLFISKDILSQTETKQNNENFDNNLSKLLFNENLKIINLGPKVNSKGVNYAPTITSNGKTIFFVSDRAGSKLTEDGVPSHDFWAIRINDRFDTNFEEPYNIDKTTNLGNLGVNTPLNEGAASVSADGKSLYFTGCNRPDGYGSCDIYYTEYQDDKWGRPINLGTNVNSKNFDTQPSIAPNNKRLYFTSTRKGPNSDGTDKTENMDIWYCDYDESTEEWLPAKNLEAINTSEQDCSPFICPDGLTLIFSSKGHKPNLGGLDFYVTKYDPATDKWSKPQNLGKPLNTENDDLFLTIPASADVLYFSSQRKDIPGKQGSFDLYMGYVPGFKAK
ncbi:MAG: hypothetical protein ABSG15_03650 [FCB group bacterium]|jgi:Tol biopolymer transport system component